MLPEHLALNPEMLCRVSLWAARDLNCLHAQCSQFHCHSFAMLIWGNAVQVSFVSLPEYLDFDTELLGGTKLESLIPSLKAWLMGFVQDSLLSMYVLPEHFLYQIDTVSALSSCLAARGGYDAAL